MKKILASLALFSASTQAAWAYCFPGAFVCTPATRYDVNVMEVALCRDATCVSSYVLGSGAKSFDIASAAVGTAVGSYAKTDGIPEGTYTHFRAIMGRTLTITGAAVGTCTAKTNAALTVPNVADGFDGLTGMGPSLTWNDAGQTQIKAIVPLGAPLVVTKGMMAPVITVKFDTAQGLACYTGVGGPISYPSPPAAAISVN